MTLYLAENPLADDVPAADAAEQRQSVDVTNVLQREANLSDVIGQAIIVALPDENRDVEVTPF